MMKKQNLKLAITSFFLLAAVIAYVYSAPRARGDILIHNDYATIGLCSFIIGFVLFFLLIRLFFKYKISEKNIANRDMPDNLVKIAIVIVIFIFLAGVYFVLN